jgi:hypothetical protein
MFSLPRLLGWSLVDVNKYAHVWKRLGGSVITNPEILDFIHARHDCKPSYMARYSPQGKICAAVAVWGGKYPAGDTEALHKCGISDRRFGTPEITQPVAPKCRPVLPSNTRPYGQMNTH